MFVISHTELPENDAPGTLLAEILMPRGASIRSHRTGAASLRLRLIPPERTPPQSPVKLPRLARRDFFAWCE